MRFLLIAPVRIALPLLAAMASTAWSSPITLDATWLGANEPNPKTNPVVVTGHLTFDISAPALDIGGPLGHSWWFNNFTEATVTVTGSTNPLANDVFPTEDFGWIMIDSSAATPLLALSSLDLQMNLGANPIDYSPSAAGFGELQVGGGGGFAPGAEYVLFQGAALSELPEPGSFALLGAGALLMLKRRRKAVQA